MLYNKIDNNWPVVYLSNKFDTNMCSVFNADSFKLISKDNAIVFNKPRMDDIKKYKLMRKFKRLSTNYIFNIQYDSVMNKNIENEFINNLNEEIEEIASIDNIFGSETKLNDVTISDLKSNNLTVDDGFKIKQHLVRELENNNIILKSILVRGDYLMQNLDKINKTVDLNKTHDKIINCPFCGDECFDYYEVCYSCGQNIRKLFPDFDENNMISKSILDEFNL